MKGSVQRKLPFDAAESQTLSMRGNSMRENRETPATPSTDGGEGRSEKANCRTSDAHVAGESDGPIVPAKRANKAGTPGAESVEERGSPKGNTWTADSPRTQSRNPREIGGHNVRRVGIVINPDRHYPREEPDEVVPHVRICAGGRP